MATKTATKPTTKVVHRSSETGRFVPEKYAEKHKRTTETERVRVPKGRS